MERDRLQAEQVEQVEQVELKLREQDAREEAREQEDRRREEICAIRAQVAKGPEHVIKKTMSSRAIKAALDRFKQSSNYDKARQAGWASGLIAFVQGPEAAQAGREGLLEAETFIQYAKSQGEDLWSVCRRYGFYTPVLWSTKSGHWFRFIRPLIQHQLAFCIRCSCVVADGCSNPSDSAARPPQLGLGWHSRVPASTPFSSF